MSALLGRHKPMYFFGLASSQLSKTRQGAHLQRQEGKTGHLAVVRAILPAAALDKSQRETGKMGGDSVHEGATGIWLGRSEGYRVPAAESGRALPCSSGWEPG